MPSKVLARALVSKGPKLQVKPVPWFPLAVAEDGDPSYEPGKQLTADALTDLVANFDLRQYRPPILGGPNSFNTHCAESELSPLGWVTSIMFDGGFTLWVSGEQLIRDDGQGALDALLAAGFIGRSIRAWAALPGYEGPVLRHVAILGNEPEGQLGMGLPSLAPFLLATDAIARSHQDAPELVRSFEQQLHRAAPAAEEIEMNQDEIMRTVQAAITTALVPALAPINAKLASLETAQRGVGTAIQAADERIYRADLQRLSDAGKLAPAEIEAEVEVWRVLDAANRVKRFTTLDARPAVVRTVDITTPAAVQIGTAVFSVGDYLPAGTDLARCQPGSLGELSAAIQRSGIQPGEMQAAYAAPTSAAAVATRYKLRAALVAGPVRSLIPPVTSGGVPVNA